VHFTDAVSYDTNTAFLNPAFVEALFPKENIFLSLGSLNLFTPHIALLPAIAALTRIQTLRCTIDSLTTLFNELLLVSKHGIRRAVLKFSRNWPNSCDFTKVALAFKNIFFINSYGNGEGFSLKVSASQRVWICATQASAD
jgi:hypothetical protein